MKNSLNKQLTQAKDFQLRILFMAIGFSPIISLSLSAFEVLPLHISGPLVVLPSIILSIVLSLKYPNYGRELVNGIGHGILAVLIYDCTRWPFVAAGLWSDFIPKIGNYLLNTNNAHWSIGYLWRYLGNGGGMGMAFNMALPLIPKYLDRFDRKLLGIMYGVGIFFCLLLTLFLSPAGTTYLFRPTILTGFLGLVGHIVYGGVLGVRAARARIILRPRYQSIDYQYKRKLQRWKN